MVTFLRLTRVGANPVIQLVRSFVDLFVRCHVGGKNNEKIYSPGTCSRKHIGGGRVGKFWFESLKVCSKFVTGLEWSVLDTGGSCGPLYSPFIRPRLIIIIVVIFMAYSFLLMPTTGCPALGNVAVGYMYLPCDGASPTLRGRRRRAASGSALPSGALPSGTLPSTGGFETGRYDHDHVVTVPFPLFRIANVICF
jgi:hypothetical protein